MHRFTFEMLDGLIEEGDEVFFPISGGYALQAGNDHGLHIYSQEQKRGLNCIRRIKIEDFSLGMLWKHHPGVLDKEGFWHKTEGTFLGQYQCRENHMYHYSNTKTHPINAFVWQAKYCSDGLFYTLELSTGVGERVEGGEATTRKVEELDPVNVSCKLNLPVEKLIENQKYGHNSPLVAIGKPIELLIENISNLESSLNKLGAVLDN